MYRIVQFLLIYIFIVPASSAETYLATRQELWFHDSSYFQNITPYQIRKKCDV